MLSGMKWSQYGARLLKLLASKIKLINGLCSNHVPSTNDRLFTMNFENTNVIPSQQSSVHANTNAGTGEKKVDSKPPVLYPPPIDPSPKNITYTPAIDAYAEYQKKQYYLQYMCEVQNCEDEIADAQYDILHSSK